MNDDIDIEEVLKRYRSDPGAKVKQAVLSRFTQVFGGARPVKNGVRFWTRPIPLYVAAATIIIAVALSFFAGRRMSPSDRQLGPSQETYSTAIQEVEWEAAPNDLL
jgi:hypothetical protein